jgi:hypothetical protein
MTVAGFARTNFTDDPIPAGFFCSASQPFAGMITFKGVPLAVDPPNSLGKMDTAVRRLDDAVFNDQGEAATRIQLLALSLASTQAIETSSCPAGQCPYQSCHCDPNSTDPYQSNSGCDHLHCIWTCVTQSCCTSPQ